VKRLLFAAALALSTASGLGVAPSAYAAEVRIEGPMMVFFGPNASTVEGQAIPVLENIKGTLEHIRTGVPKAAVLIEGYADPGGETQGADKLSQARAKAVRDFLIAQGVPAAAITVRARGLENPMIDGPTAPEKLNRRAEIFITNGEP